MTRFVYQRVHVAGGRALHLAEHLDIAARAIDHIYGFEPLFDEKEVAGKISGGRGGETVLLYFIPKDGENDCEITVESERVLLERGYTLSPLRPVAVSYDYSIPYGGWPTGFQLAARAFFDDLALRQHKVTRSVHREGEVVLSCGEGPLFGIRGKTIFTASLIDGAVDSVERNLVIRAAEKARLDLREEPILHPELKEFDELFFADAAGITSLAELDGAKFMSLVAHRLVENFTL